MSVESVLGFVEYNTLRSVDNVFGYLIASVSREAVHEDRILVSDTHKLGIYLIVLEDLNSLSLLCFLAHGCPCVCIDYVSAFCCFERIFGHDDLGACDLGILFCFENILVRACISLGACYGDVHSCLCTSVEEGICHIVSVAQVSHLETLERALMLLDRKEVSQYLCRVLVVSKTVDHRDPAVLCEVFDVLMLECSDHDAVDHSGQYVCSVVDGLASAYLDVVVAQEKSHTA